MMMFRRRWNILFSALFVLLLIQYFDDGPGSRIWRRQLPKDQRFPLVASLMNKNSTGGVWHIPKSWLSPSSPQPNNIVEAAVLAASIAAEEPHRYISNTRIPRIIHQTWKSTDINRFPDIDLIGMEMWLQYATGIDGEESAYVFWNDEGAHDLMQEFEPEALKYIDVLPSPVEKSDAFRVIVCNTIGGVYADIDTTPLRNPATWIESHDLSLWTDQKTGKTFGQPQAPNTRFPEEYSNPPVGLILGIEGDQPDDTDTWWRTGYEYPVQVTQWALAGAKNEPVMNRYLQNLQNEIWNATEEARVRGKLAEGILKNSNTIALTGPAAVTKAAKDYLHEEYDLRWQSISGLHDGGRSKLVGSTLILPITGFSPGRGRRANMGSKPITDHDARLKHNFQGSWKKKLSVQVEFGKFCRNFLGSGYSYTSQARTTNGWESFARYNICQ